MCASTKELIADSNERKKYNFRKSSLTWCANRFHILRVYAPHLLFWSFGILIAMIVYQTSNKNDDQNTNITIINVMREILHAFKDLNTVKGIKTTAFSSLSCDKCLLVLILASACMTITYHPTYLISFATFKAPESWQVTHDQLAEIFRKQNCFNEESLAFMKRIVSRSGTGQRTAYPLNLVRTLDGHKADFSLAASRTEAETIIYDVVEQAMKIANLKPKDIDVLVINCSLFSPTPSLCASVISHFQMRSNILSYNLSGMGCGASLLAMDLARRMLRTKPSGGRALFVSTEIACSSLYLGNERSFLVQNTLFRMGGSAVIISNKWTDGPRAWFKLLNTVRVQGTTEQSYQCVFECEDSEGIRGVRLSKDIVKVAGKAMQKNLMTLGPKVLPLSELAKVALSLIARFVTKAFGASNVAKVHVPDFKRSIDHFCIHAGGKAVIDGIQENLKLEKYHAEASKMTLYNFGNTSSSSVWYELEYIMNEQKSNPLKTGDRVMQLGFGSGFKCTSGVWIRL